MRNVKHAEVPPSCPSSLLSDLPLPSPLQFVNNALQDMMVKKTQQVEALQSELSASAYLVKKAQVEIGLLSLLPPSLSPIGLTCPAPQSETKSWPG